MKVVSKYFNPETYRATGKMSYRVSSSLISNIPVTDEYFTTKKIEIKKSKKSWANVADAGRV